MKGKSILEHVDEMESRRKASEASAGNTGVYVFLFLAISILLLILGGYVIFASSPNTESKDERDNIARIRIAKENIQKVLVDPQSAEFNHVYVKKDKSGKKIICGYVNAKNRFGGYTGYEKFISFGGVVALQSQNINDFGATWDEYCK